VTGWLAVVCAASAAGLCGRHQTRVPPVVRPAVARSPDGWLRRRRLLWCLLAAAGAALFAPAAAGPPAGVAAAVGAWVVIGRSEPPEVRRDRERVRRDLPLLVGLLAATLRAGAAPGQGVAVVCAALPGPAADRLAGVAARLALGMDPAQVWASLDGDPALAPLGRTMGRAQATGAPVVPAIERLADDLVRRAREDVEERARAVGVKAALPLGLCLLPAFLLVGIVPLVAGLLTGLGL
jgi:Flp pilus assembly protein TadB